MSASEPTPPPTRASFQPYIPASQSPVELTIRALVLGSVLGIVFAASSVYLALKVGMTVSASIPIAVLSIAVFRLLPGKSSILENTIVQTTGSAGESLAFGVAAALPALLLMGFDVGIAHALLVAGLGGILGVLMMIPLRHGLIVEEHGKLTYPEGTACADVLIAGEKGGTNARTVIIGFFAGGLYKLAYGGFKLWRETIGTKLSWETVNPGGLSGLAPMKKVVHGYIGGSIAAEISPELLGVGYIIGPRVAGVTFAGGVMAYLVMIPMIQFFGGAMPVGDKLLGDLQPNEIRNAYLLYIGAGAVATGGMISLARSLPTIVGAFRRGIETLRNAGSAAPLRTEQDLPITIVFGGAIALVVLMWLLPPLHINPLAAVLIVVFGFFFVTVSSRITGEIGSSSNPISGMVVATLLLTCLLFLGLGWTSPSDRFMALTTAAIVGIAASNGGATAQDLKTAYLVGGTPYRQQIALAVGVCTSAALIGGTLVLLNNGAAATIPETWPDRAPTELTTETTRQLEFPWQVDVQTLSERGVEPIENALWAHGMELRGDGTGAYVLRTFSTPTADQVGALAIDEAGTTVAKLGNLGQPLIRDYQVGYVRGDDVVPNGKYLVDAVGQIEYVVDPGVGGRYNEFRGQHLTRYEAPKARLFALIIDGILTQKLPWTLVLIGVGLALVLELAGVPSLPFAVGVYLPISTSAPIFVGGCARWLVDRIRHGASGAHSDAEAEFSPGVLLSSGYIAGGAIAGVILAMVALPAGGAWLKVIDLPAQALHRLGPDSPLTRLLQAIGETESADPVWSVVFGLAVFLALAGVLVGVGLRGDSGAQQT